MKAPAYPNRLQHLLGALENLIDLVAKGKGFYGE
jgi:hypothetical protein